MRLCRLNELKCFTKVIWWLRNLSLVCQKLKGRFFLIVNTLSSSLWNPSFSVSRISYIIWRTQYKIKFKIPCSKITKKGKIVTISIKSSTEEAWGSGWLEVTYAWSWSWVPEQHWMTQNGLQRSREQDDMAVRCVEN